MVEPREARRPVARHRDFLEPGYVMVEERFYEFGRFSVDLRERTVRCANARVPLTPKAFDILRVLLRHHGLLVTKQELLRQVWPETFVEEGNLAFNISTLRRALENGSDGGVVIETVPRHGYRFVAPLTLAPSHTPHPSRSRTVGRAADQRQLVGALDEVRRGRGRLVCVTGEPGIGKTTLIEEFLQTLAGSDRLAAIGRGHCSERLAGTGAYLPLLELLESLCRGPFASERSRALKSVAPSWFAQIATRESLGDPTPGSSAASQERLKWELAAFLGEISRAAPAALFLDDMQWADTSTVDVLAYLAARFDALPILVTVAYRSSEMLLAEHPFAPVQLNVQGRGRGQELSLGLLTPSDVDDYLALEFPDHAFPAPFRALLHTRTAGNPLFLVDLLRYLRDRGFMGQANGKWQLLQPTAAVALELPESTRSVVRRTIDRLDARDQRMLAAASVAGHEFLSSVVGRAAGLDQLESDERLDTLQRVHGLVRRLHEEELPDRTLSVRYRFVHALYQDALYGSLTASRRMALSGAIAAALESHYGSDNDEIAAELGPLLSYAREFSRAARCFLRAAQRAARLCANHEAIALARRGVAMCEAAEADSQREHLEALLYTTLGLASQAVHGYAGGDVEYAYRRALQAARASGDEELLLPVLVGLWLCHQIRGELQSAHGIAEELLIQAAVMPDPRVHVQADRAMGGSLMDLGRFSDSAECLTRAIACHAGLQETQEAANVIDPGVACRAWLARVLWPLGYPDQASAQVTEAVARARALSSPQTLTLALTFAAIVHHMRGEASLTLAAAEEAIALSGEHGMMQTLAWASIWRGWAHVQLDRFDAGVADMRKGLAICREIGAEVARPQFLGVLAEALGGHGYWEEALSLLNEALSAIAATGEGYYEAEVHRLRGRILAYGPAPNVIEAEAAIGCALQIANRQCAHGWGLRAAMELCGLPDAQGRADHVSRLASEYAWFSEGFETQDLRAARSLLDAAQSSS